MVQDEWRLPLMRFRVCSLSSSICNCWMDNLRPGGALRCKVEDHRLGRSGSGLWQAGTSKVVAPTCLGEGPMGWPPWASIERNNRMLVFMGLANQCSMSSTDAWLKHTTSMAVLGEQLRRVMRITQLGWEMESGALFLGSNESIQLCWVSVKGCHIRGLPAGSVRDLYVD
jgi:hypothetical protein